LRPDAFDLLEVVGRELACRRSDAIVVRPPGCAPVEMAGTQLNRLSPNPNILLPHSEVALGRSFEIIVQFCKGGPTTLRSHHVAAKQLSTASGLLETRRRWLLRARYCLLQQPPAPRTMRGHECLRTSIRSATAGHEGEPLRHEPPFRPRNARTARTIENVPFTPRR